MFGFGRKNKQMKREIIINAEKLETRVAILENGSIEEFQIEHPTEERIVGSVFRGRIQNLEEGLKAAFVDIGLKKNAFIHYWDMIPEDSSRPDIEVAEKRHRSRSRKRKKRTHQEMSKLLDMAYVRRTGTSYTMAKPL